MRVSKHSWKSVRREVSEYQPAMADIIDTINPNDKYAFYKVRYYFGDTIIKNGVLHLPIENRGLTSLNELPQTSDFRKTLSYSPIPTGMILSNKLEVYAEPDKRIAPLAVLSPGTIFGLWETLDPSMKIFVARAWNISAGARTLFFLPKISEMMGNKRLASAYGIKTHVNNTSVYQQWHLFKALISATGDNSWYCDILFFSNTWFTQQEDSNAWNAFRYFILNTAWEQTKGWRSKQYAEIMWETFLSTLAQHRLRPTQNELYCVRHLFDIAYGIYPGLRPAMDEQLGPLKRLQDIYANVYKLHPYAPILFAPFHGAIEDVGGLPIYHSLNNPTNINYTFSEGSRPTPISALRHIIHPHEVIELNLAQNELPIIETIKPLKYHYFHKQADPGYGIFPTTELPNHDPTLAMLMEQYPDKKFPSTSTTLWGCITLTHAAP